MSDVLKTLTGSVGKFVLAWLLPSAITLGLAVVFIVPHIPQTQTLTNLAKAASSSGLTAALLFVLFSLTSAVLFAYASLPIYRILEGYALPAPIRRRMLRRQMRRWGRLQASQRRFELTGRLVGPALFDELARYPSQREHVQATRLGNALKAMERFGVEAYGLDSQSLWYELLGVVPDGTRKDVEESRAPVDFFVSAITHASALALASLTVGLGSGDIPLLIVAVLAAMSVRVSYSLAVNNVLDWGLSVKAVVNLGRRDLATRLGLVIPREIYWERQMWFAYTHSIEKRDQTVDREYDDYRMPENRQVVQAQPASSSSTSSSDSRASPG